MPAHPPVSEMTVAGLLWGSCSDSYPPTPHPTWPQFFVLIRPKHQVIIEDNTFLCVSVMFMFICILPFPVVTRGDTFTPSVSWRTHVFSFGLLGWAHFKVWAFRLLGDLLGWLNWNTSTAVRCYYIFFSVPLWGWNLWLLVKCLNTCGLTGWTIKTSVTFHRATMGSESQARFTLLR